MRGRIFLKLFFAYLVVIAACTLTLDIAIRRAWVNSLQTEIESSLREKVQLFALRVQAERNADLPSIARVVSKAANARATVITSDGLVLADSDANPADMENHATRPEFVAALHGNIGTNTRRSHTLGINFLYTAAPIPGGAVRLAYPLSALDAITGQVRHTLLLSSLLAAALALLLASFATQNISRRLKAIVYFADRIAAGDLSARIAEDSTDEIGKVATALDKTARQLQEVFAQVESSRQELEALLNSMQEAVIAVSNDGRLMWANQRMERMLPTGIRRNGKIIETVRDPEFLRGVQEALESRRVTSTRVSTLLPGRTFTATTAPMPGGGAVAVLHDLTETERVEKTRRDFIANVSHELRTPLTSIQGYAETLSEAFREDDPAREFVEIIRRNAQRMYRLTEDLLTLARVESGEQRMEFHAVTPGELLAEAELNFQDHHRGAGIELSVMNTAQGEVEVDRDALRQVFSNLLDNAVKYGGTGGKILLGSRDVEDRVLFYIRDFGPGIPSEHLARLFERFYRVDKARSVQSGGTGLGLAIAKHIVRAHGGEIRAESELNHGAVFSFILPRKQLLFMPARSNKTSAVS
ncbi:multi-sensor signal transduction histidine kinase [Candidatus Koribacter versatilis Ellin345]|uniref:histidine kinase n=1 Tax=Koribacter versatilis (strain Ellin345) TaxID=204669 RepID=Q1IMB0_KORVE|nr:ATP-binding protein [Candidatus Koribacter versatilis]ABF41990.1 multi-sensor signal transduction histidine kinase [Candidatus Koribacter versatilis Ellin345]